MKIERIFYVSAGGADIIQSHEYWREGGSNPGQVSLTFSGLVEDFIRDIGAKGWLVSARPEDRRVDDGDMVLEHRRRDGGGGVAYYTSALRYCIGLVRTARAFRADVALLDSGTMPFFMMALFRVAGIRVVPILHNCLWPNGFRPAGRGQRMVQRLDGWFWRRVPWRILAVSPAAARQVAEISGGTHAPVAQFRPQFVPGRFAAIPPVDANAVPFRVMFIGRVTADKGVLDIPDMARRIEDTAPGAVRWTVCGDGAALPLVRAKIEALGLTGVVDARGWTTPEEQPALYAQSHISIVPTRSDFPEGMAMTAVEAILAGRPIVTNPVVPALEILRPAAVAARPDDAASHADAVLALATDRARYRGLRDACPPLQAQFYDRSQSLAAVLRQALCGACP